MNIAFVSCSGFSRGLVGQRRPRTGDYCISEAVYSRALHRQSKKPLFCFLLLCLGGKGMRVGHASNSKCQWFCTNEKVESRRGNLCWWFWGSDWELTCLVAEDSMWLAGSVVVIPSWWLQYVSKLILNDTTEKKNWNPRKSSRLKKTSEKLKK